MNQEKNAQWVIGILSAVVIGLVVFMYIHPGFKDQFDSAYPGFDKTIFPAINASINTIVSVLLILALYFIKRKDISNHKLCTLSATFFSALFLVNYVFYHNIAESTKYGGDGAMKYIYFFILITHVFLAAAIFPFILMTLYRALTNQIEKHRKIAKYTWYVWFYVSVTGVIVYRMIKPYY
ncbi:MAG: DUF420 domain-containing protein [Bacteroidetes bacterium]|nr:DUF420 domain-containing protein [Bacteroidota bacterium]